MKTKTLLLAILFTLSLLSCAQDRFAKQFILSLDFKEVSFEGNSEKFDPPRRISIRPNSEDITQLPFGEHAILGVRYVLTERGDNNKQLFHNAIFYELSEGKWQPITDVNHSEPAKVDTSTSWLIETEVNGARKFMVDFEYLLLQN